MRPSYQRFESAVHADRMWLVLVVLAAALYLLGLGGSYAPTNGDEMVYIHIARMTAESGHWLPLQSELIGTRNTKPPLLIWQAMVAGGWGQAWSLFALRLPSVAYTLTTTALLACFAYRMQGGARKLRTACVAASLYLLFFSTFRYGRVYLTSAPETFWLALPMWWVLWQRVKSPAGTFMTSPTATPGALAYTGFGVAMGLGAAYKSFALLAPAAAALWCAVLLSTPWSWRTTIRTTLGTGWSALLGLGIFALWFVLDPDPASVWQEFVVAENAGKMSSTMGYWQAALSGPYPMWTQLLAYPANGGLLALPVLVFCMFALRHTRTLFRPASLSPALWVLLSWIMVWLVVFTIPNQRSERYVIPAMPAVAIGMALVWDRLPRIGFWLTLLITAPALVMLARISWVMGTLGMASGPEVALTIVAAGTGLVCVLLGLFRKAWAGNASLVAVLSVYASFTLMVQPISKDEAGYSPAIEAQMRGQRVAVPNGFTGQYERFHFVLHGARITPYDAEGRNTGALYPEMPPKERLARLLGEFDAVIWLQEDLNAPPSCLPGCTLLAQRWHVKSRHKDGEITLDNLWQVQDWLFRREWLLTTTR
jgi:4-amino-4-deoxy-L-arabinose transferase-like glycosyltransferase